MKFKLFSIILLSAVLTSACGSTNTPAPTADPVDIPANISAVTAEGTLLPALSVELAFAQGGVVSKVFAQPGASLSAGDVIAQLVGLETARAELANAQFELVNAKKAINDLQNAGGTDLAQAVIGLKDAQEKYDKAIDYLNYLRDSKKVPQTEVRRYLIQTWKGFEYRTKTKNFKGPAPEDWIIEAENDVSLKKAELESIQRTYDRLKNGVDADQLPVLEARLNAAHANVTASEAAIEFYELRAPFNGTLLSMDLNIGEAITPTLPIAFLADMSHWIVETKDLAEIDVAHVAIDDPVVIQLDAFPGEKFRGTVTEVDPVGREYLGDMTYKVTITLIESDQRFMWNMTATVTVNTAGK